MSGDAFKKVQPGQRLEITAEVYNVFIDAALAVREHKQFGTEASPFFRQSGVVKVKPSILPRNFLHHFFQVIVTQATNHFAVFWYMAK